MEAFPALSAGQPQLDGVGVAREPIPLAEAAVEAAVRAQRDEIGEALRRGETIPIDPEALADLCGLLATLRARNVKIVGFYSPVPTSIFVLGRERTVSYREQISRLFQPEELIVDFNTGDLAALASDLGIFRDAEHYSQKGSARIMAALSRAIASASADPSLPVKRGR